MALVVIDSLEFDTSYGTHPSMVHVSGNIYAIAYSGPADDGWLVTVSIDTAGAIGVAVIDSFEFDSTSGEDPHIIHISGNVYAIAYERSSPAPAANRGGWVITVEIDSAGNITEPAIDSLRFFVYVMGIYGLNPYIIHVSGNVYAITCTDINDSHGQLYTVDIDSAGNIANAVVDSHEFDTSTGASLPSIIKVTGTTYAIAYTGGWSGWLKTITIADDGTIGPEVDTLEFDDIYCSAPRIVQVAGDIYAIAYTGSGNHGFLVTVEIDSAGNIAAAVTATSEFDTTNGISPDIIQLSTRLYAIAYQGTDSDGYVIIVPIESDGTIGSTIQSLEFDTGYCLAPCIVGIRSGIIAIAYRGYGNDGWLKTIGDIEAPTVTTDPATGLAQPMVATPNGTLDDDGGMACDCGFEYGETESYGTTTPTESKNTGETFSQAITGLSPGTIYHFRAIATNSAGTSYGSDRIFRTRGQYQGNPNIDQLIYQHVERMGR